MFLRNFVLLFLLASTPVLTSVILSHTDGCSSHEFMCDDGDCVDYNLVCDGHSHCFDGSDEKACSLGSNSLAKDPVLHREKRQNVCRKDQWKCRDGSCISFDGRCDGIQDCSDGSDETHALCRNTPCQTNWFRCTYGACVDGAAPCNGQSECVDNSDELLPRCRNETDEINNQFRCQNGQMIPVWSRCDGAPDCTDGSDETVRACAGNTCPSYLFQCAYGACVDKGADCDGKVDCADGSDEDDELCNRISSVPVTPSGRSCVVPQSPPHGTHSIQPPNARPGQVLSSVVLNVTCNPGYGIVGKNSVICFNGIWSAPVPECIRFCNLNRQTGVEYRCVIQGDSVQGTRECQNSEPEGTIILPSCKRPNYYNIGVLKNMKCVGGSWDYPPTCMAECGTESPEGFELIIGGDRAKHGELPWHAGIYTKTTNPYMQICGGSLISNTLVVSAAHCFWNDVEKKLPAERFAVALGKIYRPWNNPNDTNAQKSDVSDIKIPNNYDGASANFQQDIAIVTLSKPVEYKPYVLPVCVDFDYTFENRQLQPANLGKVAGWGITSEHGKASQVLKVVKLPFVPIEECKANTPPSFRAYITSDKICAGYRNGTALCKGDSGGGLVFPELDRGINRYYLRGVVSTAPNNENNCNAYAITTFTEVIMHERLITRALSQTN